MDTHTLDIVEGKLDISYEPAWEDEDEPEYNEPEKAVFLVTRCCPINHDHYELNKKQAIRLRDWLTCFINGDYDE